MLINLPDLLASFAPDLEPKGFRALPQLHQWRRDTDGGFQSIIISPAPLPGGKQSVELHLGVRHNATEELVFPFTNGLPGFRPNSMSLVTPAWKIMPALSRRWFLEDLPDWDRLIPILSQFLDREGLFFLERYQFVRALDELYNSQPEKPCTLVHNQHLRAFRGMAIAHLRQRTDFSSLAAAHRRHLEAVMAPPHIQDAFDRLSSHLDGIFLN